MTRATHAYVCRPAIAGRALVAGLALLGGGWLAAARAETAGTVPEAEAPRRIVSINMCTDELALRLADPDRIRSVTWLSQHPFHANMAELARTRPANYGRAEEILAFHPDLVLAGRYTARSTVAILRHLGVRVEDFGVPTTLAEVRAEIRKMAVLLGVPERGEAMIARMDADLAAISARVGDRDLRAIVLRPNGFTAAKGSLVDDILNHAGLRNMAAELDLGNYGQVPLETLVLGKADVLIIDNEVGDLGPSVATEILHHPVIRHLSSHLRVVSLPSRLWTCAGPAIVEAVAELEKATRPRTAAAPAAATGAAR